MHVIETDTLHRLLDPAALIDCLRSAFRDSVTAPPRHHHTVPVGPNAPDNTLLLMPAWQPGTYTGVKVVSVAPGNAVRSLPTVQGTYLLFDGQTGTPLAALDGRALTLLRTAAASALAADFLARADAEHLLMVGAGALAPYLIRAHAHIRPIQSVRIWNRTPARAERLAGEFAEAPYRVTATRDLAEAASWADVISCATLSQEPLIRGAWLQPGTHLDLVGGFTPTMREADDAAVHDARLFVDTVDGALTEAGDLIQPLRRGVIERDAILADLAALCRGAHPGRRTAEEITLFKSVGTALEDWAAARLAYEQVRLS